MTAPAKPRLKRGLVYRTEDFSRWATNPPRLAKRLVSEGKLMPLAQGLYAFPILSRFGPVPPTDEELMKAFLKGGPFVITGPELWNALGLGATALHSAPLVYNTKRSGRFVLGGRAFLLRRVAFPENPPPEWFVVDLLEHADQAGVGREAVFNSLEKALHAGRFDGEKLLSMATQYGTRATRDRIGRMASSPAVAA